MLKDKIDYDKIVGYNVIFYASGAGVQAALKTDSSLMYALNVNVPIEITLQLKKHGFKGIYVSFGSYMEIGLNDEDGKAFKEKEVLCSDLPVTNDYALSKRLYGRYMQDFIAEYIHLHFILPNMFSEDDLKPGTRLVPYTLQYLQDYNAGKNPQKTAKQTFFLALRTNFRHIFLLYCTHSLRNGPHTSFPGCEHPLPPPHHTPPRSKRAARRTQGSSLALYDAGVASSSTIKTRRTVVRRVDKWNGLEWIIQRPRPAPFRPRRRYPPLPRQILPLPRKPAHRA